MRWPFRRRPELALSIIVITYDMPEQALNTVHSLGPQHQRGVRAEDYEIVVVENRSQRNLSAAAVRRAAANARYIGRDEKGVSPAQAINAGLRAARGASVGLLVDGARLVTPGVVRGALDAIRMDADAVAIVPGFHIGDRDHAEEDAVAHDEETGRRLLDSVPWREDGYRLFDIGIPSGANPFGCLHPLMESNAIFARREAFDAIGGADERFDLPGGGMLNLDIYRQLLTRPGSLPVLLIGEANFHQHHGGVTTRYDPKRAALMAEFNEQYVALRGASYIAPAREPFLLGTLSAPAERFVAWSAVEGRLRFERFSRRRVPRPAWDDSPAKPTPQLLDDFPPRLPWRHHHPGPGYARRPAGVREDGDDMTMFLPPSLTRLDLRYKAFSTWVDHCPFGYDLVTELRPGTLVELGTQAGMSYFTFCQAMRDSEIPGSCYAVDTWQGDEHTGSYDDSTFERVNSHNRNNYLGFSYLLRMRFDEAAPQFGDESIDLLHIDGYHTYEAVSEDFATWYPKVKPGGIVLFHDINARFQDFGAWRFWDEVSSSHESFAFRHGFGLGVIRKPGGDRSAGPLETMLFDSDASVQEQLRAFYAHAAYFHHCKRITEKLEATNQGSSA